ncbi:hypothetical protein [Rubellimicrobium roseum]|uniref:Copper-binding protein n=1 Tax=Rubellimicrobium roseum TaxID=687525 RepID=A0A5C4NDC1_9RHOB|nr:hypothetical protein [Rubellimicrobium roseum]TNC66564.1 hypothetical protein FHG71_16390 [Rubellimicrobium roseum]
MSRYLLMILTAVVMIGAAELAHAQATTDAIAMVPPQDNNGLVVFPSVTLKADGELQVRSIMDRGEGFVLGSMPLAAGTHENVRLSLRFKPMVNSVLAVVVEDGEVVYEREIEVRGN